MLKALEATPLTSSRMSYPQVPLPSRRRVWFIRARGLFLLVSEALCLALLLFTFSVTSLSGGGLTLVVNL